jgi:hypothetical protein
MIGIQTELPLEQVVSDLFRDFKGDETGGQHAMRGFNFQVWHAVLEALREYKTGEDYAVVLEWQQDVAILNSSKAPTRIRFLQMKKHETSNHWKFKELTEPGKEELPAAANDGDASAATEPADDGEAAKPGKKTRAKKPKQSFLAKLYAHRRRFKDLAGARLVFVSNAKYEIPDGVGGKNMESSFELTSLDVKLLTELEGKMRAQLQVPDAEAINLVDIGLAVSDCPLSDSHKFLAGELAEMQIGSELNLSAEATILAVLVIASYVHLRGSSTKKAKNLQEILERGVTRADVDRYLAAANDARQSTQDLVKDVIDRLDREEAPFTLVTKMRRELSRACVEITNRAGPAPVIAAHLKALHETKNEYENISRVTDILSTWYEDFQKLEIPEARDSKREYLYCLMSMIIQNANPIQQLPPVPTDSQSEDKK